MAIILPKIPTLEKIVQNDTPTVALVMYLQDLHAIIKKQEERIVVLETLAESLIP